MKPAQSVERHEHTVALTRFFDVSRERVFEAWTRAEHLAHWFGPKDFTIHSVVADPRPGGQFRLCMRSPEGKEYWVRGEYREVAPPERLVIFCAADDEKGIARLEEVIEVTLSVSGAGTELGVTATAVGASDVAAAMLKGMDQGWAQTVDRLGLRLADW